MCCILYTEPLENTLEFRPRKILKSCGRLTIISQVFLLFCIRCIMLPFMVNEDVYIEFHSFSVTMVGCRTADSGL